jgi:hypothetical protein
MWHGRRRGVARRSREAKNTREPPAGGSAGSATAQQDDGERREPPATTTPADRAFGGVDRSGYAFSRSLKYLCSLSTFGAATAAT